MAYLKPQSPIKYNEDHIYPLTTADQIIMDSGNRLSGVGVYLEKPDGEDTTVQGNNADTLGGIAASDFVLKTEMGAYEDSVTNSITNLETNVATNYLLKTETASDSNKLFGYTFDELKAYMLDLTHPIGSYYWSSESTDPNSLFGGTWEQIKDQFILAAGDGYTVGSTGGEAAHTLTENEMPSHSHSLAYTKSSNGPYFQLYKSKVSEYAEGANYNSTSTLNAGSSQAHNNMPPYLVAYCWRRTA